jgi:hypothetical protein
VESAACLCGCGAILGADAAFCLALKASTVITSSLPFVFVMTALGPMAVIFARIAAISLSLAFVVALRGSALSTMGEAAAGRILAGLEGCSVRAREAAPPRSRARRSRWYSRISAPFVGRELIAMQNWRSAAFTHESQIMLDDWEKENPAGVVGADGQTYWPETDFAAIRASLKRMSRRERKRIEESIRYKTKGKDQ